ncbi:MAG: tRNA uridine-5-carboxymethylaminomethyl(34) synthesis GTPase MnmE [Legionellales bacterium]|nr:tRNA uridine-5-carboxymethylaminomethyl(34) synthesis GTPase MnmE [Legionellales bacterium]
MQPLANDTIAAPATPPGRGGIGIIRVSGSLAIKILEQIIHKTAPPPNQAIYTKFYDNHNEVIDMGLILFFVGPHSFTGEDVVEFQGHGGPVVIDCLLRRILQLGARLAKPGEFSERAFLNDKLDLVQAEAIADLIDAASEQALKSAMRSLQGEFSKRIEEVLSELIYLRIYVEAAIDFPEEEIDFLGEGIAAEKLIEIINKLTLLLETATQGVRLRDGLSVVIVGKPNAGKSSLLNQLTGRETAIVTEIAGTTRDLLREQILLEGIPLHITDTAGLRESSDIVEQEGIRRARAEMDKADLILLIVDHTTRDALDLDALLEEYGLENRSVTIVFNKIDLMNKQPELVNNDSTISQLYLSAKENLGIELLKQHLLHKAGVRQYSEGQCIARLRHLNALIATLGVVVEAEKNFHQYNQGELLAEDLRSAQQILGEITGRFTADDLLGKIFSSFCIGK